MRALAKRIASGDVPTRLLGARLVELELGAVAAGTRLRGEIEERLRKLLSSLGARAGSEQILFIPGLEQLLGQGPTGSSLADALRPALARGDLRLLATTTPDGLRKLTEKDPVLGAVFYPDCRGRAQRGRSYRDRARGGRRASSNTTAYQSTIRAVIAAVRARQALRARAALAPTPPSICWTSRRRANESRPTGMPLELDQLVQRLGSLSAQLASLAGEEDASAQELLKKLEAEQALLAPRAAELRATIEGRRGVTAAVKTPAPRPGERRGPSAPRRAPKRTLRAWASSSTSPCPI